MDQMMEGWNYGMKEWWKWLKMAGNDCKWLERGGNDWKWLAMAGMDWKRLEIDGNDWNSLEINVNSCKEPEMAIKSWKWLKMVYNGLIWGCKIKPNSKYWYLGQLWTLQWVTCYFWSHIPTLLLKPVLDIASLFIYLEFASKAVSEYSIRKNMRHPRWHPFYFYFTLISIYFKTYNVVPQHRQLSHW